MREIKFRGFLEAEILMLDTKSIQELLKTNLSDNTIGRIIWQQYTGLKDKNGVEIYEGDVVENDIGRKYKIVHSKSGKWMMKSIESGIQMQLYPENNHIQVIANIHENKELL